MKAEPLTVVERQFWHVMTYGCDAGEFHELVYLEVGCEGPRDRVESALLPDDHPFNPGGEIAIAFTADGRMVVPVPFVAFRCPAGHHMTHVRWSEDRDIERCETELPEGAFRFLYPSDVGMNESACGVPVVGAE